MSIKIDRKYLDSIHIISALKGLMAVIKVKEGNKLSFEVTIEKMIDHLLSMNKTYDQSILAKDINFNEKNTILTCNI